MAHIWVGVDEPSDNVFVLGGPDKQRPVGRVGERSRHRELSARVRVGGKTEMLLAQRRPSVQVVIDELIDEGEMHAPILQPSAPGLGARMVKRVPGWRR